MSFAHFDAVAIPDDSALSTLVMSRLTTQLLTPDGAEAPRQPRRTRQRHAPVAAMAVRHGRLLPSAPIVPLQTKATSAAVPVTPATPATFTARPRETARVWLESVWWTSRNSDLPELSQATTSSLPITA